MRRCASPGTSHWPETWIVTPLLLAALAFLAWHDAGSVILATKFCARGLLPSGGRGIASLERFLDHDNGLGVQGTAVSLGGGGERGEQGVRQAQT